MKSIETLMQFGFNVYESKILFSLARLKSATAKEIKEDSLVPVNKVYEILEDFQRRSIVQLLPEKPKKYSLINLKQVLKGRLEEKKKSLDKVGKDIEDLFNNLSSSNVYEQTFWVMEGVDSMVNKIVETLEKVNDESIGFIDVWVARPENLEIVKKCIKRGVKFYFIGDINDETKPYAKKFAKLGVKIRHYPIQGAGYSIFDKKYVQLRITEKKVIIMWVENAQFANILRQHFFEIWKQAKPIKF
jgi:sugar-specific transcriptional regulator TrmB